MTQFANDKGIRDDRFLPDELKPEALALVAGGAPKAPPAPPPPPPGGLPGITAILIG
jgi:hypothetical protein